MTGNYKDKISSTFGDKSLREQMKTNPLLRGQWEKTKTRALSPTDHLIAKVGIALVQAVESCYETYQKNPNEKTTKSYLTWRLRLHRRLENKRELLEQINEARNLGLNDSEVGPLCWDYNFSG